MARVFRIDSPALKKPVADLGLDKQMLPPEIVEIFHPYSDARWDRGARL
ncbi:hypothetical protein [Bradyrhizobium sp. Ec3.3]|nr:hypothetical protein [Bradyrhizobium sp. Ec3.3]